MNAQSIQATEKSLYEFKWLDEGETVYVIQNKEHIKAGSLGMDFSFIDSNSSPYQETTGLFLSLSYYFSETWGVDVTYKKYDNKNSTDLEGLLTKKNVKPLMRRIDSATLFHINWIPFYGKINTFNKIFFFDWGLGIGGGQFETAGNYETFEELNAVLTLKEEKNNGFNLRSFVKFYAGKSLTMGFEYNLTGVEHIISKDGTTDILYYNDLIATIGFIF